MMRTLLIAAVLAAAAVGAAAQERFVGGTEDLPLMAGLSEVAGRGMVFDTPAGRIVEAYARGPVTREQVLEFYTATLPQLGWRADGAAAFSREDEVLKLEFPAPGPDGLVVLFTLSPAR
ncbi:MAG: hypothetical protein IIC04_05485 [Proteobacteria bacterium]|nr:hypothetical protein [Pseudomonadota bacterium]